MMQHARSLFAMTIVVALAQLAVGTLGVFAGAANDAGPSPAVKAMLADYEKRIAALEARLHRIERAVPDVDKRVDQIEKSAPAIDKRLDKLEKGESGATGQLGKFDKSVRALENRLAKLEKGLPVLENRVVKLEKNGPAIEARLGKVEKQLPTQAKEIATLRKDLTATNDRVGKLEAGLPEFTKRVAALNNQLPGIEKRFAGLEQLLPVGSVTLWWGPLGKIPQGWEICDGQRPATPGATLAGNKPDLLNRFVKGPAAGATATSALHRGGSDALTLTVAQLPSHTHTYDDVFVSDFSGNAEKEVKMVDVPYGYGVRERLDLDNKGWVRAGVTAATGGGKPFDNRPAFQEMFFIIRVK